MQGDEGDGAGGDRFQDFHDSIRAIIQEVRVLGVVGVQGACNFPFRGGPKRMPTSQPLEGRAVVERGSGGGRQGTKVGCCFPARTLRMHVVGLPLNMDARCASHAQAARVGRRAGAWRALLPPAVRRPWPCVVRARALWYRARMRVQRN